MANQIILNKENFSRIFYKTTGILRFPNPFDYEGEEREIIKRKAYWYLSSLFENPDTEQMGIFSKYGTISEAAEQLITQDIEKQCVDVLEGELGECIMTENNEYIQV